MEELDQCSAILRNKMEQCRPPVHLSVLMRAYRMDLGKEVPYEQYGYSNPADFLRENFSELTLVKCDRTPGGYMVHLRDQAGESEGSWNDAAPTTTTTTAAMATTMTTTTPPGNLLPPPVAPPNVAVHTFASKQWVKKKPVPIQFKMFLARILDHYPLGISARDFVDVFYKMSGSALSYKLYGYPGHLSMFKDLPDVFRIEQQADNEHKLFPVEKSDSRAIVDSELKSTFEVPRLAHNNGVGGGDGENRYRNHASFQPANIPTPDAGPDPGPVRKWITPQGNLITVKLDGNLLVSTGCLAAMIGMTGNDILLRLKQQGIDIRGVKFLTNDIPDHTVLLEKLAALKCPSLTSEDGRPVCVISLVPFESCCFILRAFAKTSPPKVQVQTEETRGIFAALEAS